MKTRKKATKKKPTPAQRAARKKDALSNAAAFIVRLWAKTNATGKPTRAFVRKHFRAGSGVAFEPLYQMAVKYGSPNKSKKRNATIIKANRIDHLDVSKIHSLGKTENPNYIVEAIPKYTSTVKRDVKALSRGSAIRRVQREVEGPKNVYHYRVEKNPAFVIHKTLKAAKRGNQAGWMLGKKFYAKRAGQKPLPGDSILDLNSGIVYQRVENPKRKVKGNPKGQPHKYTVSYSLNDARGKLSKTYQHIYAFSKADAKKRIVDSHLGEVKAGSVTVRDGWTRELGRVRKRNIQMMAGGGEYPMRASWDYDPVAAGETRASRADYFSRPHVIGGKKISGARLKREIQKRQQQALARAEERLKKARTAKDAERLRKAKEHLSETRAKIRAAKVTGGALKTDKQAAARRAARHQVKAETKARKATTSRLASRALQRSVPLKRTRRNPDTPAQKLQEWRGYPKAGEDTLRFPTGTPSGLYKLGVLKKIILSNGTTITPNAGQAWLCADTNGKLHIGGKTNTAARGRIVDWPKDNLGKVRQVEYEARKPHLGDNERTIYFHKLGEDDGIKPTLHSDGEGGLLFKGGNYQVTSRGLVN